MSNCRWKRKLDLDFRFQTRGGKRPRVLFLPGQARRSDFVDAKRRTEDCPRTNQATSPLSMRWFACSKTALATSVISARVGKGFEWLGKSQADLRTIVSLAFRQSPLRQWRTPFWSAASGCSAFFYFSLL